MKQSGKSADYKILGIVLSVISFIFVLLANVIDREEKTMIVIAAFLAIFSAICAVLSFMKAKKEKMGLTEKGRNIIPKDSLVKPAVRESIPGVRETSLEITAYYTLIQVKRDMEIMKESFDLARTTTNLDVFCMRYDLALEKAHSILQMEQEGKVQNADCREVCNAVIEASDILKAEGFYRITSKALKDAEAMKSDRGRCNRYQSLLTALESHAYIFETVEDYGKFCEDLRCGIASLQSENKESYKIPVAIKVEHTYDYPVYPNQDTDIPADSYMFDENGHCLGRSDGKPLNDADAAYLMREGVRKAIEAARRDDNPKFHRSAAEKELCFRFFYKYGAKSDQLCDVFQELAAKANTASTADEKLALLQQSADAFYKAREWHYHCSKGGMMWFQDMWECFYNSQNERFCWVDKILENIKEAQKEIAVIEPWILNQAQAGFLQTDIYRAFPDDNKTMLRNVITRLVNQGKIQKQKKGSSYFIQAIVPEEVDLV